MASSCSDRAFPCGDKLSIKLCMHKGGGLVVIDTGTSISQSNKPHLWLSPSGYRIRLAKPPAVSYGPLKPCQALQTCAQVSVQVARWPGAIRENGYSAGVTIGRRRPSLGPIRALSSSSHKRWCSFAQLTSTVPSSRYIQRKISVLTPVGTALIGLRAGQSITWDIRTGETLRLTVLKVGRS